MDERQFALTLKQQERYQFAVSFDGLGGAQLTMDEPTPLGEGRGPNAARVLGAAIAHCLSASLLFCLKKARVDIAGMEARVTGSIVRNEEGRLRIGGIRVELVPQVVPEAKQRIGRCLEVFEDFCMVTQSLRQGIDIAVEVTVEDPASAT
jgi:uncharacterized OsmC-like protein